MGEELAPQANIEDLILTIRGQKVMIDRDLAELFGVKTKQLNRQVKRNLERFPEEFMFLLSEQEKIELVPNWHRFDSMKHSTSLPMAFTEHGVAMLATVLKNDIAVKMSIFIIKSFIALRKHRSEHAEIIDKVDKVEKRIFKHDSDIRQLVRDVRKLAIEKSPKKLNIGFLK